MSSIKKYLFLVVMIIALVFTGFSQAQPTSAVVIKDFCDLFVTKRDHTIAYWHMDSPGSGSTLVDGFRKSQFSRTVLEDELLQIASGHITYGKYTSVGGGKYKVEMYDPSLNQTVRTIFKEKRINSQTYYSIMYPIN